VSAAAHRRAALRRSGSLGGVRCRRLRGLKAAVPGALAGCSLPVGAVADGALCRWKWELAPSGIKMGLNMREEVRANLGRHAEAMVGGVRLSGATIRGPSVGIQQVERPREGPGSGSLSAICHSFPGPQRAIGGLTRASLGKRGNCGF